MEHLFLFLSNLILDLFNSSLFEYFITLFFAQAIIYTCKEFIRLW